MINYKKKYLKYKKKYLEAKKVFKGGMNEEDEEDKQVVALTVAKIIEKTVAKAKAAEAAKIANKKVKEAVEAQIDVVGAEAIKKTKENVIIQIMAEKEAEKRFKSPQEAKVAKKVEKEAGTATEAGTTTEGEWSDDD